MYQNIIFSAINQFMLRENSTCFVQFTSVKVKNNSYQFMKNAILGTSYRP